MSGILEQIEASRLNSSTVVSLRIVIWAVILGFILSFFIVYYKRRVIGALVRAIRNAGAVDPESAKTLVEIGQENNVSAIEALKKSSSLRRLISICPAAASDAENSAESPTESSKTANKFVIDENTRFYITKEAEIRSRVQYGDKEDHLWPIILASLALILLGILSFFVI